MLALLFAIGVSPLAGPLSGQRWGMHAACVYGYVHIIWNEIYVPAYIPAMDGMCVSHTVIFGDGAFGN